MNAPATMSPSSGCHEVQLPRRGPLGCDHGGNGYLAVSRRGLKRVAPELFLLNAIKYHPTSTMSTTSEAQNFFISYNHQDTAWAEWIAWHLERSGYSTVIQAWDFKAGSNFVLEMDEGLKQAQQVIAVLSPHYFASQFTPTEWTAKFAGDPRGLKIVPVRVQQVQLTGLLAPIVYIDLVDKDETSATHELLTKIKQERAKPLRAPAFPGAFRPVFPGVSPNTKLEGAPATPLSTESKDGSENVSRAYRLESETSLLRDGFQSIGKSYLDVQMYREKWDQNEPIQSVTMVHVSGGVFRQQRTRWQMERANKHWPENLPIGGDVKAETRDEMSRRLKIELEGAEPWPDTLRKLRIFIGNENKFKRWKKANNRLMETQEASRLFWIGYLRKLKELYGALYYGRNREFVAELYEIERSDFYAHVFNTKTAGHIVGCNLFSDWDCPTAYQVLWSSSKRKPKDFSSIERAIEDIRNNSSICSPIRI